MALAGACGNKVPAQSADQKPGSDEPGSTPADLKQQFEREADPIQKQPVRGEGWQAYIEADAPPKLERTDGYLMITADLGWDGPLNCFVYDDTIDAGAASHAVINEAGKAVNFQQLLPYHLGGVGLDPTLGIRGVYHVDKEGVVAAGDLKLMLVPRLEYPILCTHDAPGFAQSFARVTRDFAESFEFESKMPPPVRGELWHAKLEDVPVGFVQRFTFEAPTGAARTVSISARFVPRAPGEISFEDTVRIVDWDPRGMLESGRFLSFENGQSSFELNLEKAKGRYQYTGTVQEKPISGNFRSQPIAGQLALERRLKKIARSKRPASFHQWEYLPGLDPVQTSKVTYKVSHESGVVLVKASMGERAMVMQANARGVVQQQLFRVGARHVQVDLVQEVGEL